MAGVICLKTYQLLATARRKGNLPAENGTDQHPAQVALVVQRIQIRGHDIASIGIDTVVRPLYNRRRSWYCSHVCRWQHVEVVRLMEGMDQIFFRNTRAEHRTMYSTHGHADVSVDLVRILSMYLDHLAPHRITAGPDNP
jgi:hypothetical protein